MTAGSGIIHQVSSAGGTTKAAWAGSTLWATCAYAQDDGPAVPRLKRDQVPEVKLGDGVDSKDHLRNRGKAQGPVSDVVSRAGDLAIVTVPRDKDSSMLPNGAIRSWRM